jgi:hypothetical protein
MAALVFCGFQPRCQEFNGMLENSGSFWQMFAVYCGKKVSGLDLQLAWSFGHFQHFEALSWIFNTTNDAVKVSDPHIIMASVLYSQRPFCNIDHSIVELLQAPSGNRLSHYLSYTNTWSLYHLLSKSL